ncbi:DarT ssDNA thymidine ADP-ribosyltransferase family protein [Sphingomonas sp. UYP23]
MATIDEIVKFLTDNHKVFYHFTDRRNLTGIRQHGILSMHALRGGGLAVPAPGGNQWSLDADAHSGMDRYVHLCFLDSHPMEWKAKEDGRIQDSLFLRISPEVLRIPGAVVTDVVSNSSGCTPHTIESGFEVLDLEVIYTKTDWKEESVKERLKVAKKYELLIPNHVATDFIANLPNG